MGLIPALGPLATTILVGLLPNDNNCTTDWKEKMASEQGGLLRSYWTRTSVETFHQQLLEIVIVLILYGAYIWSRVGYGINRRLKSLFTRCRSFIPRKELMKQWNSMREDACVSGPGWRILPLSFSMLLSIIVVQVTYEGNLVKAMNLAVLNAFYTYVILRGTYGQVELLGRVLFLHQFIVNWYDGTFSRPEMITRPVLNRSIALVLFFEHTDESFLQMLMFSWAIGRNLGWSHTLTTMPMKMFLLFLLPVRLSGIREWVCSQDSLAWRSLESKRKLMIAFIIPLITMMFSRAVETEPKAHQQAADHLAFLRLFGFFNLLVLIGFQFGGWYRHDDSSSTSLWWSLVLHAKDEAPVDTLTSVEVAVHQKSTSGMVFVEEDENDGRLRLGEALRFTLTDSIFVLTATVLTLRFFSHRPFICLLVPLILSWIVLNYRHRAFRSVYKWKISVFFFHALVVTIVCAAESSKSDRVVTNSRLALIGLTTIRMLFVFEKRSFVRMQKKLAALSVITGFLCQDDSLVFMIVFLSLCTVVASIVIQHSRAESARILTRENESQAFLSHAVKQKFSGVANAVESVLQEVNPSDPTVKAVFNLLETVFQECRRGQQACHGLSLRRNMMLGKPRPRPQREDLLAALERRLADRVLLPSSFSFEIVSEGEKDSSSMNMKKTAMAEMDLELLEVFLMRWANGSDRLEVRVQSKSDGDDSTKSPLLELRFKRTVREIHGSLSPSSGSSISSNTGASMYKNHPTNALFLKALQGSFVVNKPSNNEMNGNSIVDDQSECVILVRGEIVRAPDPTTSPRKTFRRMPSTDLAPRSASTTTSSTSSSWLSSVPASPSPVAPVAPLMAQRIPPNLSFAILDDNLLVRRNLERIINKQFQWNRSTSITSGSCYSEAVQFPQVLAEGNFDIAIFDENLEFESSGRSMQYLKGTDLARIARDLGFRGCMILHSADSDMDTKAGGRTYDPQGFEKTRNIPFDGYICKTTSQQEFVQGVVRGWERYQLRLGLVST